MNRYSKIFGEELSWGPQPNISTINRSTYPIKGRCIDDYGDVTVNYSDPTLLQQIFVCNQGEFQGIIDFTAIIITNGPETLQASQVGISVEPIVNILVNIAIPPAPTITSPLTGSTLLASNQTVTGTCQPGATVRLFGDINLSPLSTACSLGGTFSRAVVLTTPDGSKTINAEQEDSDGNISPSVSVTIDLAPVAFALSGASFVNLSITTVDGSTWNMDWGDGVRVNNIPSGATVSHTYAPSFTGAVRLENLQPTNLEQWESNAGHWSFNLSALTSNMTVYRNTSDDNITTGDISNLPAGMTEYRNLGSNTTSGDVINLPASLLNYYNQGANSVTGDIANLPAGLLEFNSTGNNTTFGDIANLPPGLIIHDNKGANTVTGDVVNLPNSITEFTCEGSNTIFGDIADIGINVVVFSVEGNNTLLGDVIDLKLGLLVFIVNGQNTIVGNIANLPTNLILFIVSGDNTLTGDIINLPASLIGFFVFGLNTILGDISNIGANLDLFLVDGANTLTGDISTLKVGLTEFFVGGSNTTTGNIASLPNTLTNYVNTGVNTTSGDIASLPNGLITYFNDGNNTTSGSINNLPTALTSYSNIGLNTTTSTGSIWNGGPDFNNFALGDSTVRSQLQIDDIFIALAPLNWIGSNRTIDLTGPGNAAPSAASLAARTTLLSKGVTILTN